MKIKRNEVRVLPGVAVALALLAFVDAKPARADESADRFETRWQPVKDAAMAGLSGRYQGVDGVTIAFAIDIEGLVNGAQVMQKSVASGPVNLANATPQSLAASLASMSKAMTLVLQNKADHQSLQVRTVLNVSLTEMRAVRALQSQFLIASWQTSALRP